MNRNKDVVEQYKKKIFSLWRSFRRLYEALKGVTYRLDWNGIIYPFVGTDQEIADMTKDHLIWNVDRRVRM